MLSARWNDLGWEECFKFVFLYFLLPRQTLTTKPGYARNRIHAPNALTARLSPRRLDTPVNLQDDIAIVLPETVAKLCE